MFHSFIYLLVHVFVRWFAFLGTSPLGIIIQVLTLLATEGHGGWLKWNTWKVNWRGGLKRACLTLLSVWLLAFFVCAISVVYDDHRALVSENQRLKHPQLYTEPSNSLRKRTVQLADDLEAFEIGRANKRQFLLQGLPSGTPEQEILRTQKLREFDIETSSEYVKQGLRGRTVGVLQELRGKGLDIEWLGAEGAAPVRPLVGDELRILRELAYHLDEKGNAFRIEGASDHP